MRYVKNPIPPVQIRPFVKDNEPFRYWWSFDNQFTSPPIVEDFNKDGLDDLLWIQGNYRTGTNSYDSDGEQWPTYPFLYFESNGDGTFTEKTDSLFPSGQYVGWTAARYIYDDLDGDGVKDFLIIDQGYESIKNDPLKLTDIMVGNSLEGPSGGPWSSVVFHQGAPLVWWKGKPNGPYEKKYIKDAYFAFHHNGSAADIDLDGKKELLIANSGTFLNVTEKAFEYFFNAAPDSNLLYGGAITKRVPDSEIISGGHRPVIPLKLDSSNEYALNFNILPMDGTRSIVHSNGIFRELLSVSTVSFSDLNNDNYPDMIVGIGLTYEGGPSENLIYINKGGTFSSSIPIKIPFPKVASNIANKNSAVFIDSADLNGNGLKDIVIGYENPGNDEGAGHFIQILFQTEPLVFVDRTIEVVGTYVTEQLLNIASDGFGAKDRWPGGPSWLRLQDINKDGHQDIVMFTQLIGFYELGGAFLINDGLGNFTPLHHSFFSPPSLRSNIKYDDQAAGNYQAVIGDFDGDGIIDNLVIEYEFWGYSPIFPDSLRKPAYAYLQTNLSDNHPSLLANGLSTSSSSVFGLNEFFYTNKYPEVSLAVKTGAYKSISDYYLSVGSKRGDMLVAPNSVIWGSESSVDTFPMFGSRSSYKFSIESGDSWRFYSAGVYETLELKHVERVSFNDGSIARDVDGNAGQAYRVYKAAFNREPDQGGLGYWIAQMDSGMNMVEVAARFIDSSEFRAMYGTSPTDEQYLTKVYQNVLGRDPEPDGYNWWLNEIRTNPDKTRAKVLADFSESLENKAGTAQLVGQGIIYEPWVS